MNRLLLLLTLFVFLICNHADSKCPYHLVSDEISNNFTISGFITPCTANPPNGAVNLTVTPPDNYTFAWSNGATTEDITDLEAGIYTVTVTLNSNCTGTAEFFVPALNPGPLAVTGTVFSDTCSMGVGAINLTIWAGNPPFNFNWNNGAQTEDLLGLTGVNSFSVTVTDGLGAIQFLNFFVGNYNFFTQDISNFYSLATSDNTTCSLPSDGEIVFTPLTSTAFNWIWSNGATTPANLNLSGGNYTATVTYGSCAQNWNPNITILNVPNNPTVAIAPVDAICGEANGMINLTVTSGASPYSYVWTNDEGSFNATTEDISNIAADDYSVTVTVANGCTFTSSVSLSNLNITPNITATVSPNTSCTNPNGSIATNVQPNSPPAGLSYGYAWSNGQNTPNISGLVSGNYTVTVSLGSTCSASATNFVGNGTQVPALSFATTAEDCQGPGSVDLGVTGGYGPFNYQWSNGANTQDLPSVPAGNYAVTVTTADGCTATSSAIVLNNNTGVDTTYLSGISCDSTEVGIFETLLTGQDGCDSLLITTISLAPTDTTTIFGNTCEIIEEGIFEQNLTNQFGCDSLVITTITYVGSDTTSLFGTSCEVEDVGVFVQNLANANGCDSIVVTTINLLASDTTSIYGTSCDSSQVGVFEEVFTNAIGCDSLVITTISFVNSDTTTFFETTCDSSQAGVFQEILTNQNGCDSIIITTVNYAEADTTEFFSQTCHPNEAGVFEESFTNSNGCDSVVISTISFTIPDTTYFFETSCITANVGVFVQGLTGQFGCDSTVITTITYSLSDTTLLASSTCDPTQVGSFEQNLTTAEGCDSVVITTVQLAVPDSTWLTATTCDPTEVGIFTQTLTNEQGCDSIVVKTVTLLPSSSSSITVYTCDPSQAGIFVEVITNWQGCDSIVTLTVELLPNSSSALQDSFCEGGTYIFDGMVLDAPGIYTATYIASNGCDSIVTLTLTALQSSPITEVALEVLQGYDHNGTTIVADTVLQEYFLNVYGCDSTVITTFTILPNATHSEVEQWGCKVSPNPTDGMFSVQFNLPQPRTISLSVKDMLGREMNQDFAQMELYSSGDQNLLVDATNWPPGLYLVQLKSADGSALMKLVVE